METVCRCRRPNVATIPRTFDKANIQNYLNYQIRDDDNPNNKQILLLNIFTYSDQIGRLVP